jgi:hypothetical protein
MNEQTTSTQMRPTDAATTIDLGAIKTGDQLLIRTLNSYYRFLVTDSAPRRGRLMQGSRLVWGSEVELAGASDESGRRSAELKSGARAEFLIGHGARRRQLLTSAITGLAVIKADERGEDFFSAETWDDQAGLQRTQLY